MQVAVVGVALVDNLKQDHTDIVVVWVVAELWVTSDFVDHLHVAVAVVLLPVVNV